MVSEFVAKSSSGVQRILIVEVNWMGDVLFSTPAIRAVRRQFPSAHIASLVERRCVPVLEGNPHLDEVIPMEEKGAQATLRGCLDLITRLRAKKFDRAYFLHRSLTRAFWAYLAGVHQRVGYRTAKRAFIMTENVDLPEQGLHRADVYYNLVVGKTIPPEERYYDFFIPPEAQGWVEDFFNRYHAGRNRKMVAMHVGGNWELKRWPKEYFARLIDILVSEHDLGVILTGSEMDAQTALSIAGQAREKAFVLCGKTNLKQLAALFSRCCFVVSADSGPMHVACAAGARTLCLFGPTDPAQTGPLGPGESLICRSSHMSCKIPCYQLDCRDNLCMKALKPEDCVAGLKSRGWLV